MIACEEVGSLANGLTLSCCIAVGDAAEVDIGISVRSSQFKDEIAAAASIFPAFRSTPAFTTGIALNYA